MARFVWVDGLRGPTPEKWPDTYSNLDMQGTAKKAVLQSHTLTEGEAESATLGVLALLYPLERRT